MKALIKSILVLFIAFNSSAYWQIFGTSSELKVKNEYYGDRKVISIRVNDNKVSAYYKDSNGKSWNDTLFRITPESEPYKEFMLDILEKGQYTLIPGKNGKLEELIIVYRGKKYSFYEAALYLSKTDQCGLGMVCPTSNVAVNDGRRTTTPNTAGPLERREAKDDYMTRVNIF